MRAVSLPGAHDSAHSFRIVGMPDDAVPVCRNENKPPAWLEDASYLCNDRVYISNVLCHLCAHDGIVGGIRLVQRSRVADAK